MNNWGSNKITTVIVLMCFMLIAATVVSVIGSDPADGDPSPEEEMDQMLEEILSEITSYLQIKDRMGKYHGGPHQQKIEQVAIMIKPLFTQEIDISELTIKICDGNTLKILNYSGESELIGTNGLFGHSIWDTLSEDNFGFVVTHDTDNSLTDFNTINKNTDMAYLIFKLSEDMPMSKGDTIVVTLFPSSGIEKTILLEAPLPMKSIVSL